MKATGRAWLSIGGLLSISARQSGTGTGTLTQRSPDARRCGTPVPSQQTGQRIDGGRLPSSPENKAPESSDVERCVFLPESRRGAMYVFHAAGLL